MKTFTLLTSALAFTSAVVGESIHRVGKRNVILPTKCVRTSVATGQRVDLTETLKRALVESQEMIMGALGQDPKKHGWFEKFLNIRDLNIWRDLSLATAKFENPQDQFATIFIDCDTLPQQCNGQTEWDGSPRAMVTDVANDIIYACPALFNGDREAKSNTALLNDFKSQDGDDLLCADKNAAAGARKELPEYQVFATILMRELAHTSSAIRKMGQLQEFPPSNIQLHHKIEKFGWMYTLAHVERFCDFEIPVFADSTFAQWARKPDPYVKPEFSPQSTRKYKARRTISA